MCDETDIGLVDTHAKCDCRNDHDGIVRNEAPLMLGARLTRQAGMIGQRIEAVLCEPFRRLFDAFAREAINDAGFAAMCFEERRKLLAGICLRLHGITDIRTVESGDEAQWLIEREAFGNLVARRRGCRRRQRHARHAGKLHGKLIEREVLGPEIVSPLRHAMRLIDRDERDAYAA